MLKKSLMFFIVVFLAGILILGCPNPTGKDGEPGTPGTGSNGSSSGNSNQARGSVVLPAGTYPVSTLQSLITKNSDIYVMGTVTLSGTGTVTIPTGKTLVLDAGITLAHPNITLIIEPGVTLGGSGKITPNYGTLIAEKAVLAVTGGDGVPLQASGDIDVSPARFAVLGDVTINDTTTGPKNINKDDLTGFKTLYVVGNLTVSNPVRAYALIATGNVDVAEAAVITGQLKAGGNVDVAEAAVITGPLTAGGAVKFEGTTAQGALTGLTAGSVESSVNISSSGNIKVTGLLKTNGTAAVTTTSTATLKAGSLNLGGNLTTANAVEITGDATITGTFAPSDKVTFNGTTEITGTVISGGAIVLAGTGKVTLPTLVTTAGAVTVENTGGVTLTGLNDIGAKLKATGVIITGSHTGAVIDSAAALSITKDAYITVPSTGSIETANATKKVTITGAILKSGTYTATNEDWATLTLGDGTDIEVQDGGSVAIPGSGQIVLSRATSKITLLAGGSLVAGKLTSDIIDSTRAEVLLSVQTAEGTAATNTAISGTSSSFILTAVADSLGSAAKDVIVGRIKWNVTGKAKVTNQAGDLGGTAGTLKAGVRTKIVITGTGSSY